MAKKTKLEVDITNEPRLLKTTTFSRGIDTDEIEVFMDLEETLQSINNAIRSKIIEEFSNVKELFPNQSVHIRPGFIYISDHEITFNVSREETDSEVEARVKARDKQLAKDMAELRRLQTKLGVLTP